MSSGIANGAVSQIPPTNPVTVVATLNGATNPNLIYTVPTGKTFYCTGMSVSFNGSAGTSQIITISVDSVDILAVQCKDEEPATVLYGTPLFAATSGEEVEGSLPASLSYVNLWGYLL